MIYLSFFFSEKTKSTTKRPPAFSSSRYSSWTICFINNKYMIKQFHNFMDSRTPTRHILFLSPQTRKKKCFQQTQKLHSDLPKTGIIQLEAEPQTYVILPTFNESYAHTPAYRTFLKPGWATATGIFVESSFPIHTLHLVVQKF